MIKRFLICAMPITGHVNPGLPIARALVERGHEVWWYTGRRFRGAIEATGARYVPMRSAYDFDDRDLRAAFPELAGRRGWARRNVGLRRIFLDPIPGQVADLRRILSEFHADVLLAENMFVGAGIAHELGGPPWATFGISVLGIDSRDTAPFNTLLPPDSSRLGRLRNRLLNVFARRVILRDANQHFDRLRASLGLPAVRGGLYDVISPYLYMQASTPAFEYPRSDLPPQVHFIGPLLFEPAKQFTPPGWWGDLQSGRPVVLVNQGTIATDPNDLIVPTLRALAEENVLVVATTGGKPVESIKLEPPRDEELRELIVQARMMAMPAVMGGLGIPPSGLLPAGAPTPPRARLDALPPNARVEPFIPFAQLMPHVDVMVTNGGNGGVQFALAHGVPLVVAGATEEKPEIAARVAWSGAGIDLKTGKPTPEQIRAAVRDVLLLQGYRRHAERIRDDYRRHDAPSEAVELLERLAATGRPVLRAAPVAAHSPQPAASGRGRTRTSADI